MKKQKLIVAPKVLYTECIITLVIIILISLLALRDWIISIYYIAFNIIISMPVNNPFFHEALKILTFALPGIIAIFLLLARVFLIVFYYFTKRSILKWQWFLKWQGTLLILFLILLSTFVLPFIFHKLFFRLLSLLIV